MGGCRCTYRNCSLRTDGKTHMFHYPVFDKVRCHQWLTNAHKLEFLNLKVSQLKNRVVCQHHFKDDNFMNYMKNKLTFDAVPTEDGPYCDSSQLDETKPDQEESKVFSIISLDDIENEYLTIVDKKANFSVKYGDFLTNCDLMELDSLNSFNQISDTNQINLKRLPELGAKPNVSKNVSSKRPVKKVRPLPLINRKKSLRSSSRRILKSTVQKEDTVIEGNVTINPDSTVNISNLIETSRTEEDPNSLNFVLNVSEVPIEFESTKSNDKIQENIGRKELHDSKLLNDQLINIKASDDSKLLNDQTFDDPKLLNNQAFDEPKLLNHQSFDEPRLLNNQSFDEPRLLNNQSFDEPRLLNNQSFDEPRLLNNQSFDEPRLLNNQSFDEPRLLNNQSFDEPRLLNNQSFDEPKVLNNQSFDEPKVLNNQSFVEPKLLNNQSFDVKVLGEPKLNDNNAGRNLIKERKKIRIISEKKISEPVPIIGKLEPVSPTRILTFPNKRRFVRPNPLVEIPELPVLTSTTETTTIATDTSKNNIIVENSTNEPMDIISSRRDHVPPQEIRTDVINIISNKVLPDSASERTRCDEIIKTPKISPKTSLLKNKLPPERAAAIAEKRKFNMKLRDIIEDCLDKLDDPDKTDTDNRKLLHKTNIMQSKKQQVGSYLAKDPELPSVQDYTIAYLEARMKKMEDNLINKIGENSKKILELKQAVAPSLEKKNVHTQTSVSEDVHKRQLYQELSKYLSQEANSLIYEELFINKYVKDVPKCSSPKRRKRR